MRRAFRLRRVFLCRGNLHNSRRQGSHNYGKSGWPCRTSRYLPAILIQDFAFVKLSWLAAVDKFTRRQVLVGQALLPVHVCGGVIARDSQEWLSYPAT
jgi:hypothetical protein